MDTPQSTFTPASQDYQSGYEKGLIQEHLTCPDLTATDSISKIQQLATLSGYRSGTPARAEWLKGYMAGHLIARERTQNHARNNPQN